MTSIMTDPSKKMSVLFTAVLQTGGNVGPFQGDTTLIFNRAITNVGEAYDISTVSLLTGLFKAPVTGFYCFSFSYQADKREQSGLTLMKNDEAIVKAFNSNQPGIQHVDNASSTACLELQRGDHVSVVLPKSCHVCGIGKTTSFTGFLISKA
ncbi:complement C1q tumor necrosis factor-related protein 3-like isoform X1 [Takifugu flavidus]|uniref:complement C1q tumor necrosis factor-related protein 3-like isoform X1 n=1 Tax=Takifugu flavidus TaxID=433684 RepID=UPI0025446406|nr:complement C1q tumor necrosis factor-related protein 3-like isoform X1 [Takifugu flavidus]XP_056884378.1 complement C1q tumor necrosis factor-related protein 3-like isoform X1 [Takifugu flavidus]